MVFLQLALLSHCLSDFIFQTNDLVELRMDSDSKKRLIGNRIHAIYVSIILAAFLIIRYNVLTVIIYSSLIGLSHFLVDLIKSTLSAKIKEKKVKAHYSKNHNPSFLSTFFDFIFLWHGPILFILDQLLHIFFMVLIWTFVDIKIGGLSNIINPMSTKLNILLINIDRTTVINTLNYCIIYIFACFGGRFLISTIMSTINYTPNTSDKFQSEDYHTISDNKFFKVVLKGKPRNTNIVEKDASKENKPSDVKLASSRKITPASDYIGIFERFIIITLVINGAYPAITLVFAAKSIARFRELEDKSFVEYYLVGTLLSTSLGILSGLLLKYMINQ